MENVQHGDPAGRNSSSGLVVGASDRLDSKVTAEMKSRTEE